MNFQWRPFLAGVLTGLLLMVLFVVAFASGPWSALSVAGAIGVTAVSVLSKFKTKAKPKGLQEGNYDSSA